MKRNGIVALVAITAACGGASPVGSTGTTDIPGRGADALKAAVRAYSAAYLTGNGETAWSMLSSHCQQTLDRDDYTAAVTAAGDLYGSMPVESITVDALSDSTAHVSYTFAAAKLDQHNQLWRLEEGTWHYDNC